MVESETLFVRIWLLGEFHAERRKDDGIWETVGKASWENSYARPLLKRLLCATGRRAARSDILDDLWPNKPFKLAEKYLNNASSKLRQVFSKEIIKPLGPHGMSGYQLAEQTILWADIDECEALMTEAERIGLPSADALQKLEQASKHFERGGMLEGENGQWCLSIRTQWEATLRYCHLLLAKGYEEQNKLWQARNQYERLLELNPLDEEALSRLLLMLHRHSMIQDLRSSYETAKRRFQEYGIPFSPATKKQIEKLLQEPPSSPVGVTPLVVRPHIANPDTPPQPHIPLAQAASTAYTLDKSPYSLLDLDMLMISQRQFMYDTLNVACATLILFSSSLLPQENRKRLALLTNNSKDVEFYAINALRAINQRYWLLYENASADLLNGMAGYFTTLTQMLKESHPELIYEKLCVLVSESALLLGTAFLDLREHDLAWKYYTFSMKIAQDTRNTDLWAVGVGRLALLSLHWGQPQQSLPFLEQAQKKELHNERLRAWLAAIEAEIHALMGNVNECLRALKRSKLVNSSTSLTDDIYMTGYNLSRSASFEGACFIHLRQPECALPALQKAFTLCDPTSTRYCSNLVAELGTAHAQLGDVKTACDLLLQALDMTAQTKSLVVLQRISKGRAELDPWKESVEVRSLDKRVFEMLAFFRKLKEQR